jgi:ribosome biogenesis GTPase / thiamine phosphate phosphatase
MTRPARGKAPPERTAAPLYAGIVTAAYGRRYRVEDKSGVETDCVTRGRKSDLACGDRVRFAHSGGGVGVIETVDPRSTLFYRSDARRHKLIAANVTQIVIVVAVEPRFSEDLVNRCLAGAEHAEIGAVIALNKMDLPGAQSASDGLELYRQLGYAVVPLTAKRDLMPLRVHLAGHVCVLVGQSGMGKSTIVNGLVPQAAARVAEISTALGTGRHTTTHAELYHLDSSSHLIDSPGLQEFGLHHLTPDDAARAFIEFRPFLGQCRFRNCRHTGEPGCAIAAAALRRGIAEQRLASYRRLAGELARRREAWET